MLTNLATSRRTLALARHFFVLSIGVLGGALLMAIVALTQLPDAMKFEERFQLWAEMMGGPIVGTASGFAEFHSFLYLGWLGPPMIVSNMVRPHAATAVAAIVGFVLWYSSGFFAAIFMAFGA